MLIYRRVSPSFILKNGVITCLKKDEKGRDSQFLIWDHSQSN